jgi:hypothetical protein
MGSMPDERPRAPTAVGPLGEPATADRPGEPATVDHRRERIRVETTRHRIEGDLTLARDGYRSRVSDVLNAAERDFLTLTDVEVEPLDGGSIEHHPFLAIARGHIVFVVSPVDDPLRD